MSKRPNREILTGGKKYATKQAKKFGVQEVVFDKDARVEYLTGFHKRKVARQKKAQEFNKEQDRLQRIEERKKVRDDKKKDVEEQLSKFKETVLKITNYKNDDDDDDDWEYGTKKSSKDKAKNSVEGDNDEWEGFENDDDLTEEQIENKNKGILKRKEIYKADDSTPIIASETTVTIESLDPNAEEKDLEAIAKANYVDLAKSQEVLDKSIDRAKKYAKVVNGVSKPKKKKFRYLSKNERKTNIRKEKDKKFKKYKS